MKGILCLEDGRIFNGTIFGDPKIKVGEICFNTSMSGYQEIITDPSYAGQIVVMSYPIIGNYGINQVDVESPQPFLAGLVVREWCRHPGNRRMTMTLDDYLKKYRITAIEDIDTRALVRHIREKGEMRSAIAPMPVNIEDLLQRIRKHPKLVGQDLASAVSTRSMYSLGNRRDIRIALYDFGVKNNILRLLRRKARVTVVPSRTDPDQFLQLNPDGIVFSNGPGDPAAVGYAIINIKKLIGRRPILGICLGHQLLGHSLGGSTFRLKFGHHGANHPVKDLETGRIIITVQNHCFAVDTKSIEKSGAVISHINLNDQTLEGFYHHHLKIFSYQFHPEASPGPVDAQDLIGKFIEICRKDKTLKKS
jgi:carbamoyl-phosphate synthase small subunit